MSTVVLVDQGSLAVAAVSGPGRPSFDEFYRRDSASVYRSLSLALGDSELGRDATDEAMARAYQHWRKISGYENPAGWAYRVGLNWARSRLRKRGREVVSDLEVDVGRAASVFESSDDPGLRDALAQLPLKFRSVVVLRYLLDWSTADVAAALGVAEGTVKSRLARALERLAVVLEEQS